MTVHEVLNFKYNSYCQYKGGQDGEIEIDSTIRKLQSLYLSGNTFERWIFA